MTNNGIVVCASVNLNFSDTLKCFAFLCGSGTNIEIRYGFTTREFNTIESAITVFLAGGKTSTHQKHKAKS